MKCRRCGRTFANGYRWMAHQARCNAPCVICGEPMSWYAIAPEGRMHVACAEKAVTV